MPRGARPARNFATRSTGWRSLIRARNTFALDVEDDSALVGDIEIENFPTLAVFRGDKPVFYGVTMPQEGVVAHTLASLTRDDREAMAVPEEISGLPETLRARL